MTLCNSVIVLFQSTPDLVNRENGWIYLHYVLGAVSIHSRFS